MKIFKFFAVFVLATSLFSCSSDSSSDSPQESQHFNLTYNGTEKTVSSWQAIRQEDFIEVAGDTPNGLGVSFKFNTHGNLYQSFVHPNSAESTVPLQTSFAYYSDDSFTFELIELNTTNKTVKVNFNGKIYDNE
ncbi:MAG TPA: hypothetical protein VLB74_00265, partial [Flavobacterium sp.]|uniref:hypothetical protein n=1 Tax=Flavobacterium sp. TaxID=239 RepID=UPI002BB3DF17